MGDTVTVIGCGLIGGSFALALKRRRPGTTVVGIDVPDRLAAIREAAVADFALIFEDAIPHLRESSLVLLAAPVEEILGLLAAVAPHLREGAVVTDVGSTKTQILRKAAAVLPKSAVFIGGHPMAGAERAGASAADPLLFNGRVWLLCPTPDTPAEALLSLIDVVEDVHAAPVTIEAEEHDRIMAAVSHLPQLLSIALMSAAMDADQEHGMLEMLAGGGFLDATRVAASEYSVWSGILETNKTAIDAAFDLLEESLKEVRRALNKGTLGSLWAGVSRRRRKMSLDSLPLPRQPGLRKLIDRCDEQILKALGNRLRLAKKIGKLKANQGAPVLDPDRERRLLAGRTDLAKSLDLPADLVKDLFALIIGHSRKIQSRD